MALQRVSASAPLEARMGPYLEDGGVIVEGLFAQETIARLRDDLVSASEGFDPGQATQGLGPIGKGFVGANTIRFSSLGRFSPAYFDLLDNQAYAEMADQMLLPNCGSYWVNTGQAMFIGPGEPAQVLHRDFENWPQYAATAGLDTPEITVSAMIALDPMTEELGATRVIPGSHKWPIDRAGKPGETVAAEMEPGDALVYSGKVLHGGGANRTTDRWRRAMHLSFVVGWLVPEESNPLDYSDEDLAEYSPRVQRLLGHRSYDPTPHVGGGLWLRHVNKIEDPTGTI